VDIRESAISGSADRPNIFSKYWSKDSNILMQRSFSRDVIVKKSITISWNNALDTLAKKRTLPFFSSNYFSLYYISPIAL
jgi:hypothetical protein